MTASTRGSHFFYSRFEGKEMKTLFWGMILIIVNIYVSSAQMLIAPTSVYMDEGNSITSVVIQNRTQDTREVSLDMKFGYPVTDSLGKTYINYKDSLTERDHSLVSWVKIFPRKILLKPEEKQTIRILAKLPAGLADGMYWGRLSINSRPKSVVNFDTASDHIGAQINLTFNQVIPVVFKKGDPQTKIVVEHVDFKQDSSKMVMTVFARTDKVTPFIGTGNLTVKNEEGKVVKQLKVPLTVYYRLAKDITIDLNKQNYGKYKVDFEIESKREDVTDNYLAKASKVYNENTFIYDVMNSISEMKK